MICGVISPRRRRSSKRGLRPRRTAAPTGSRPAGVASRPAPVPRHARDDGWACQLQQREPRQAAPRYDRADQGGAARQGRTAGLPLDHLALEALAARHALRARCATNTCRPTSTSSPSATTAARPTTLAELLPVSSSSSSCASRCPCARASMRRGAAVASPQLKVRQPELKGEACIYRLIQ